MNYLKYFFTLIIGFISCGEFEKFETDLEINNLKGKVKKETYYLPNSDEILKEVYFNKDGYIDSVVNFKEDFVKITERDNYNRLIKTNIKRDDGRFQVFEERKYNGQNLDQIIRYETNKIKYKWLHEYFTNGNEKSVSIVDDKGDLLQTINYEYEDNRKTKIIISPQGDTLMKVITSELSDRTITDITNFIGNGIKVNVTDTRFIDDKKTPFLIVIKEDHSQDSTFIENKYDNIGNLIYSKMKNSDGLTVKRNKLEYYK